MKIGFSEALLIFLIFLVVLGPTVVPRIRRWYRRAGAAENAARRRRARAQAARARLQDELFARARFAVSVVFGGALVLYVLYLFLWPLPYAPQTHPVTEWQEEAVSAAADDLTAADGLDISPYRNPVSAAQQDGWLFAAVDGGKVIRIRPDGTGLTEVFSTGGDITSLAFGPDGALYLTDARMQGTFAGGGGVLRATFDGWAVSVEPLVTAVQGVRLSCPAAVTVGKDGTVYFTDYAAVSAAGEKGAENAVYTELLARTGTGSVYAYSPDTQTTRCLANRLQGAGGLALNETQDALYVSETNAGRIWRLALNAQQADLSAAAGGSVPAGISLVAQGLSGYPAGLACGTDGTIWVSQCGARSRWAENAPALLRRAVLHLPRLTRAFLLRPKADSGAALGFTADGNQSGAAVVRGTSGGRITGVCLADGSCWLANADGSTLYRASL